MRGCDIHLVCVYMNIVRGCDIHLGCIYEVQLVYMVNIPPVVVMGMPTHYGIY